MNTEQNKLGTMPIGRLLNFDMKWGHRRNVAAYGAGLKAFDDYLPLFQDAMDDDTLLVITADHGCDPTHTGSDHTREHIPVLLWHRSITPGTAGIRETFGDVGATVLKALGAPAPKVGSSIR